MDEENERFHNNNIVEKNKNVESQETEKHMEQSEAIERGTNTDRTVLTKTHTMISDLSTMSKEDMMVTINHLKVENEQ